ncbi:MAG: hypothetical protein HY673_19360 [Chloroflexi bacterium]|nr:hypothetical protein [Chloroflexota bacterium]
MFNSSQRTNKSCPELARHLALRHCLSASIAVFLVVAMLQPARAAQPNAGVISGMVTNRTTNEAAAGLEVKLETYQATQLQGTSTAITGPDGTFKFSDLDTQSTRMYLARLTYKEVNYNSGGLVFQKDQTTLNVDMSVFEPGAGVNAISSKIAHTVMYAQSGAIGVLEFESVLNGDNKVFTPGSADRKSSLELFLPKEADSVTFMSGVTAANSTRTETGLTYGLPLKPGETEFAYGYNLPIQGDQYVYLRPVSYPMASYSLLVRGDSLKIESSVLQALEPVVINGEAYQRFSAQNLAPATFMMVNVRSVGVPSQVQAPGAAAPVSPIMTIAFPAVLALALGLVLFFVWKKKPSPVPAHPVKDQDVILSEDERQRVGVEESLGGMEMKDPSTSLRVTRSEQLLQDLARLDDDFAAGLLPEDAYRQQRAEKKAQLLGLMHSRQ